MSAQMPTASSGVGHTAQRSVVQLPQNFVDICTLLSTAPWNLRLDDVVAQYIWRNFSSQQRRDFNLDLTTLTEPQRLDYSRRQLRATLACHTPALSVVEADEAAKREQQRQDRAAKEQARRDALREQQGQPKRKRGRPSK